MASCETDTPLADWLDRHRKDRAAAGVTRRLSARSPVSTLIDLASNDYLGLGNDSRVTQAAVDAARRWGAGAGASRLVSGNLELHEQLEAELARFTMRPAALVLSTGYQANLAVVASLSDRDTLIVSDSHVHASLVDACRLAHRGGLVISPHNDTSAVAIALRERSQPRALVLVESVYSVLGDAAPLGPLAAISRKYGATLIVDEAHAIGVAGNCGRGLVHSAGLGEAPHVVSTLTLSKALGSQGGAVLGTPAVIEHLVNSARPFIYDTGLAPASTAAARESLCIITAEPDLPGRAVGLAHRLAEALAVTVPAGTVLSVPMAGPDEALAAQADLAAEGLAVGCFRPPSAPDGLSRLRLTARANLSDAEVAHVLERLARLSRLAQLGEPAETAAASPEISAG